MKNVKKLGFFLWLAGFSLGFNLNAMVIQRDNIPSKVIGHSYECIDPTTCPKCADFALGAATLRFLKQKRENNKNIFHTVSLLDKSSSYEEQKSSLQNYEQIILQCADGQIALSRDKAKQYKTVKNCLEANSESIIDLRSLPVSRNDIARLNTIMQNPSALQAYSPEQAEQALIAADALEASDEVLQKLNDYCGLDLFKKDRNTAGKFSKKIVNQGTLGKHIKSDDLFDVRTINLSNKNLESLEGLENLEPKNSILTNIAIALGLRKKVLDRQTINIVDISNNKLRNLDLKKIVQIFPSVKYVNASGNQIEEITSDDFAAMNEKDIDLSNNKISKIPHCVDSVPYNAHLKLDYNYLSAQKSQRLTKLLAQPALWKKYDAQIAPMTLLYTSGFVLFNNAIRLAKIIVGMPIKPIYVGNYMSENITAEVLNDEKREEILKSTYDAAIQAYQKARDVWIDNAEKVLPSAFYIFAGSYILNKFIIQPWLRYAQQQSASRNFNPTQIYGSDNQFDVFKLQKPFKTLQLKYNGRNGLKALRQYPGLASLFYT